MTLICAYYFVLPIEVHLNGMIDDKVSRTDGINLLWIAAELRHCIPHGGKVYHGRDTTAWWVHVRVSPVNNRII